MKIDMCDFPVTSDSFWLRILKVKCTARVPEIISHSRGTRLLLKSRICSKMHILEHLIFDNLENWLISVNFFLNLSLTFNYSKFQTFLINFSNNEEMGIIFWKCWTKECFEVNEVRGIENRIFFAQCSIFVIILMDSIVILMTMLTKQLKPRVGILSATCSEFQNERFFNAWTKEKIGELLVKFFDDVTL